MDPGLSFGDVITWLATDIVLSLAAPQCLSHTTLLIAAKIVPAVKRAIHNPDLELSLHSLMIRED